MREKIQRFMLGRYGTDELNKAFLYGVIGLAVVNLFIRNPAIHNAVYYSGIILLVMCYFRTFSRNHAKRYAENQKYLAFLAKLPFKFKGKGNYGSGYGSNGYGSRTGQSAYQRTAAQEPGYRIFKCPGCKQKIRIPKGKGKIEISCPKCQTKFIRRS